MIERFSMLKQYNFKIPEELELKVKKALEDSGFEGKSEFLEDMVNIYAAHLIGREENMHEEIASYKHISSQSKEVLSKTFSHLLSTMDYNFSSTLQGKIEIEEEKKKLLEKSTLLDQELDKMKIVYLEERKVFEERAKEELRVLKEENNRLSKVLEGERELLVKTKEELSSLTVIAEQTSLVIEENKELRATNSLMEKDYKDKIDNLSKLHEEKLAEVKAVSSKQLISVEKNLNSLQNSLRLEEKKLFETSHILERCENDLKISEGIVQKNLDEFSIKEQNYLLKIDELSSELAGVNSLYNQLLGKIEVLESLEKKK